MSARHMGASVSLERCAWQLFEEVYGGRDEIDLADWLGTPIAGQPARASHPPARTARWWGHCAL
eukprot:1374210-Pyramimonas_sp.AAC.1